MVDGLQGVITAQTDPKEVSSASDREQDSSSESSSSGGASDREQDSPSEDEEFQLDGDDDEQESDADDCFRLGDRVTVSSQSYSETSAHVLCRYTDYDEEPTYMCTSDDAVLLLREEEMTLQVATLTPFLPDGCLRRVPGDSDFGESSGRVFYVAIPLHELTLGDKKQLVYARALDKWRTGKVPRHEWDDVEISDVSSVLKIDLKAKPETGACVAVHCQPTDREKGWWHAKVLEASKREVSVRITASGEKYEARCGNVLVLPGSRQSRVARKSKTASSSKRAQSKSAPTPRSTKLAKKATSRQPDKVPLDRKATKRSKRSLPDSAKTAKRKTGAADSPPMVKKTKTINDNEDKSATSKVKRSRRASHPALGKDTKTREPVRTRARTEDRSGR